MKLKINEKQIEAVLKLTPEARYKHFMKRIAGTEEVWALYDNGWALVGDDQERQIFPLWPAEEYAKLCASEIWKGYKPALLPLEEVIEELLPTLKKDGIWIGVFYGLDGKGVVVDTEKFIKDLDDELSWY